MNVNRTEQYLVWDGVKYTPEKTDLLAKEITAETPAIVCELLRFLEEWFDESPTLTVQTSGSTGTPKLMTVRKEQMMQSACMTCEVLHLKEGDTALLCMSLQYIAGKMMVVRALVAGLNLIVRTPSGHPLADVKQKIRFAAMIPLQVYNTLEVAEERERLRCIDTLIIGGGMINPHFALKLRDLPGEIYATYGMTETLSHIALCRLNGEHTDTVTYYPLPGVKLSLSAWGTLVIDAPGVCDEVLTTNDVVELDSENGFVIIGRKDTTIISGGIKMQPEMMEGWLQRALPMPFVFTSIPDERLGEAVVMLVEGAMNMEQIRQTVARELPSKYAYPKYFMPVAQIPMTGSGKIDRAKCKALAQRLLGGADVVKHN